MKNTELTRSCVCREARRTIPRTRTRQNKRLISVGIYLGTDFMLKSFTWSFTFQFLSSLQSIMKSKISSSTAQSANEVIHGFKFNQRLNLVVVTSWTVMQCKPCRFPDTHSPDISACLTAKSLHRLYVFPLQTEELSTTDERSITC